MTRAGTTTRDRIERPPSPSRPPRRPLTRRERLLRAAVVPLVVATLAWVLWETPLLAVRTVQVDGARSVSAEEIRSVAAIRLGTPLLKVDVAGAGERVRRLPQVASARVTRGWPDRAVVTVAERVPVVVVERGGQRWLADATGFAFSPLVGDPPSGVVPVEVPDPAPTAPAMRAALGAVRTLPPAVRTRVARIRVPAPREVTLVLTDATTVVWGDAADSPAKAAALAAVLDQIGRGALAPARTVDVSAPAAVVLR